MQPTRDVDIDCLRGIAIFTMVIANMGPLFSGYHSFPLRFYGSFAAPLFITLSAMMVSFTRMSRNYGFGHFCLKAVMVLLAGIFTDLCLYRILPLTTVDVLYLIGLTLPLAYLTDRMSAGGAASLAAAVFAAAPFLRGWLGYASYPAEFDLNGSLTQYATSQAGILNHWIVDGWFPLFPWAGFSLLGILLAKLRWKNGGISHLFQGTKILTAGLAVLVFGSAVWLAFPGPLMTRGPFSELFFPPVTGYILCAAGIILILFYAVRTARFPGIWDCLQALGESSLFMYLFHNAVIFLILSGRVEIKSPAVLISAYMLLIAVMITAGHGLRKIKRKFPGMPYPVKFIFGG